MNGISIEGDCIFESMYNFARFQAEYIHAMCSARLAKNKSRKFKTPPLIINLSKQLLALKKSIEYEDKEYVLLILGNFFKTFFRS